jgi:glycosyltransferase involved in cell wall biosynthesis
MKERGKIISTIQKAFQLSLACKKLLSDRFSALLKFKKAEANIIDSSYHRSANPEAKHTIAFIDHSYHKKTISSSFFIDILKTDYNIEIFWDETWRKGPSVDLNNLKDRKFECIIFWQVFMYYNPRTIKSLNIPNCFIVPMYDGGFSQPESVLRSFHTFTYISFSSTFHKKLVGLGLRSDYFQYFLPPRQNDSFAGDFETLKGFFWQRTNEITWDQIKILISRAGFSSFHLHLATDPGFKEVLPDNTDIEKYHITISYWYENKAEYLETLGRANVFFAPRQYEGIGMPFIEAMAEGKLVVAPDNPTMNEYIQNNITGLLYEMNNIQPLDFGNAGQIAANAYQYCVQGFDRWERSKHKLLQLMH